MNELLELPECLPCLYGRQCPVRRSIERLPDLAHDGQPSALQALPVGAARHKFEKLLEFDESANVYRK